MKRNIRELIHDGFVFVAPKRLLEKMASCEKVTERIAYPESQTLKERLETAFHIGICHACWTYQKQLERMSKAYRSFFKNREGKFSKANLEGKIDALTERFSKET